MTEIKAWEAGETNVAAGDLRSYLGKVWRRNVHGSNFQTWISPGTHPRDGDISTAPAETTEELHLRLLKQAKLWLAILIDAADVDPETTSIKCSFGGKSPRAGEEVAHLSLAKTLFDIEAVIEADEAVDGVDTPAGG